LYDNLMCPTVHQKTFKYYFHEPLMTKLTMEFSSRWHVYGVLLGNSAVNIIHLNKERKI